MKHLGLTILMWLLMTTVGMTNPVVLRLQSLYNSLEEGEVIEIRVRTRSPVPPRLSNQYGVYVLSIDPNTGEESRIPLQDYYPGWEGQSEPYLFTEYPSGTRMLNYQYFGIDSLGYYRFFPMEETKGELFPLP